MPRFTFVNNVDFFFGLQAADEDDDEDENTEKLFLDLNFLKNAISSKCYSNVMYARIAE